MDKIKETSLIEIHGFKYDGTFYRRYDRAKLIYKDDDLTVLYLYNSTVSNKFKQSYTLSEPTLWFFPHHEFWNALVNIRISGYYTYINLASPPVFENGAIKYVDFDLDIKSYPKKRWHIDDQNEFIKNKSKYNYSLTLQKRLFAVFETMLTWYQEKFLIFNNNFIDIFVAQLIEENYFLFTRLKMQKLLKTLLEKKQFQKQLLNYPSSKTFKLYTCGPTVYASPHIGNMRPILSSHFLIKAKKELGISTFFVHNLTDIDDKIIKAAQAKNVSEYAITNQYKQEYLLLLKKFAIDTIDLLPTVTENIKTIKAFINELRKKDKVIVDQEGLLFNLEAFPDYGKRVNRAFRASDAFYLWKNTTTGKKWKYLNQYGRPGWHTECAALVDHYFGAQGLDCHIAGVDLSFPHNENEDIQFVALHGSSITKKWLHTGQINFENAKMSKSLGNIILARDFDADIFRSLILNSNLSAPLHLNENLLNQQRDMLQKFRRLYFVMQVNSLKAIKDDYYFAAIKQLSEGNFTKFSYSLNVAIKKFNLKKDSQILARIKAWFEFIDFDFIKAMQAEQDTNLKIYRRWQMFLNEADYFNADKERSRLFDKGLL